MAMDFKISARKIDAVSVVDFARNITAGEALMVFRQTIRDEVAKSHNRFPLNLKDVTYIDRNGLGELLMAQVRELLQFTRLYTVFDVHQSEQKALASS